ncbi:nuclear transport factor 2 family protein [Acidiphilium sp. AL]|uniref:Nuclear transport factor 2 family protein n=1 Tax=Acidiphilium iwatense TaxID=768198 RepID=A0ABS9E026_9PROT|nr:MULTISPECIES: nuclear transport factor 2 family protein [Acidiphilium]MCF3948298.1 nuclear transport factor 2 family protein [Acidiphilium iwatense]MCU4161263.1 nuclear transport factor 2 family protein [Acidiphilium sp. AL]
MDGQAEHEVLQAANTLVARFAAHDTEGYFAAFAPEATFIFHATPRFLESRDAYRALWRDWEASGFRILDCRSFEPLVRVYGETAIFTHRVETRLISDSVEQTAMERETIVFRRQDDGGWRAVHEHLSPCGDT